tara:strand:+ start:6338 stop:6472 length:135 start_codon:yes stop_codon:yes gene_type:complete
VSVAARNVDQVSNLVDTKGIHPSGEKLGTLDAGMTDWLVNHVVL